MDTTRIPDGTNSVLFYINARRSLFLHVNKLLKNLWIFFGYLLYLDNFGDLSRTSQNINGN